jgi:hypothetical protein
MVGLYAGQAYGSPWALVAETPFVERARAGEEKNIRLIKMHIEITLHMDIPCKLYVETRQCLVSTYMDKIKSLSILPRGVTS